MNRIAGHVALSPPYLDLLGFTPTSSAPQLPLRDAMSVQSNASDGGVGCAEELR
jgi:hypothetical protein